jgi:hypothetical protein
MLSSVTKRFGTPVLVAQLAQLSRFLAPRTAWHFFQTLR